MQAKQLQHAWYVGGRLRENRSDIAGHDVDFDDQRRSSSIQALLPGLQHFHNLFSNFYFLTALPELHAQVFAERLQAGSRQSNRRFLRHVLDVQLALTREILVDEGFCDLAR